MKNILAIDPSGTGSSGICMIGSEITFQQFESKDWKKHFSLILNLVKEKSIELIIYENTNYISNDSKHMTGLFKLFGAIEALTCFFPIIINFVPVNQVKKLKEEIRNKRVGIAGLNYQKGKAWSYKNKSISIHELDAFLIYWIWKGNNYKYD